MNTLVKKALLAILAFESRLILKKYKPRVVGITGSVGKTGTKDAIATILPLLGTVRKSEKSYNSEFGLPLTILGSPSGWRNPVRWLIVILEGVSLILFRHRYPNWLVLEVGVDRPGDIAWICRLVKFDTVESLSILTPKPTDFVLLNV